MSEQTDFFATVASVSSDGVTLIFDGQTTPTTKKYKKNANALILKGQRVKVVKVCGTFIVEYPIS